MEWLIIGLILGAVGFWLKSWARARNINIKWYSWVFIVLAVLAFALMVMDFRTMTLEMEPTAAEGVLWLYGIPGLVLALTAVGLIWWQNRKPAAMSTKGQ